MIHRQSSGRASARPIRPPRERGTWKAFLLAALMHVLLGILLYHGVNWQNNTPAGAEAELWTQIPDTAPPPRVVPPAPPVKAQPAPPPVKDEEADIALQEKKRKEQEAAARDAQLAEQRRQQEKAQQEAQAQAQQQAAQQAAAAAQKAAQDKQRQADKQRQLAQQKLDQQKVQQQEKDKQDKQAEAAKLAQQQKDQADAAATQAAKAQADAKAKAKAQADAQAKARLDKERAARIAQMQGAAGGGTNSSGNGLASSGTGSGAGGTATSSGYSEKVQRRVRPNIVWSGETAGLETVISVRCAATGTLLSATIQRSSGNEQWDQAALRAVQRSDPMPLDTNGEARPTFLITLRPAGG
jgi:colicin import membrane protein